MIAGLCTDASGGDALRFVAVDDEYALAPEIHLLGEVPAFFREILAEEGGDVLGVVAGLQREHPPPARDHGGEQISGSHTGGRNGQAGTDRAHGRAQLHGSKGNSGERGIEF